MKSTWIAILSVFLSIVGILFLVWMQYKANVPVEISLRTNHELLSSGKLNEAVINNFLDQISFHTADKFALVEEGINVEREDLRKFEIVITDVPQEGRKVLGNDDTLLQSTSYEYDLSVKTITAWIYFNSDVLKTEVDKEQALNYRILSTLYFPLYSRYESEILSGDIDFYGGASRLVNAFLKENPNVANYVFN